MTTDARLALRARQAAETLGISARHLWQLTRDGLIPCVRVGAGKRKTVLYPTDSLRNWLNAASQERRPAGRGGAR